MTKTTAAALASRYTTRLMLCIVAAAAPLGAVLLSAGVAQASNCPTGTFYNPAIITGCSPLPDYSQPGTGQFQCQPGFYSPRFGVCLPISY